jgi:ATP-dependent DNA helicase RecG
MTRPGEDLSPAEIERLLAGGPGEAVVFLPANPSPARLAENLIALANTHGGVVLMGVSASGKPLGVEAGEAAIEAVRGAGLLSTPPLILPVPTLVEIAEKTLCVAFVPPGLPHVYSLDGRYLGRAGARNRLLSASVLTALLLSRDEAGFEARPAPGAALEDSTARRDAM